MRTAWAMTEVVIPIGIAILLAVFLLIRWWYSSQRLNCQYYVATGSPYISPFAEYGLVAALGLGGGIAIGTLGNVGILFALVLAGVGVSALETSCSPQLAIAVSEGFVTIVHSSRGRTETVRLGPSSTISLDPDAISVAQESQRLLVRRNHFPQLDFEGLVASLSGQGAQPGSLSIAGLSPVSAIDAMLPPTSGRSYIRFFLSFSLALLVGHVFH